MRIRFRVAFIRPGSNRLIFIGFPWVSGTSVLIYLAGLNNIPTSVLDACRLEGVGGVRRFFQVDIFFLVGQIKLLLIIGFIGLMQMFAMQLIVTRVTVRKTRHAIHLVKRNRNVIVSKKGMRFNMFTRLGNIEGVKAETRGVLKTIGLEISSDTPAGELAYGHQRALEIGLALAMEPELILLDEPTAGMTTEETRDAVKLIERITVGKTLIIIEHDMDVVFSIADRISVLYYGKILATGTAEEIKESQEVKQAYLGSKK